MEDNANSHYDLPPQQPAVRNSRKEQKAAQKKSKKAKRREREEQAERDERIAAEKTRQKERAERLGIVSHGNDNAAAAAAAAAESSTNNGSSDIKTGGDTKPCNTCGGAFSPGEYRSHFRSDWHRYNVVLKMKGVPPISEQEFTLCDSDAFFD